jgi:amino acid transporter
MSIDTGSVAVAPDALPGHHAPLPDSGVQGGFYARKASGLVRQLSLRDSVLLNICWVSFPLGLLYITQIGGLFPGASLPLAFLFAGLIALPHMFSYGLFAGALPRSGGDYLSISRSLNPLWGFVVNATFSVLQIFSTAFIINFVPLFALPSLFQTLAIITHDHHWATVAANISTSNGQFFISGGIIVVAGVLAIFNVRLLLRVFTVLMALSLIGIVVTAGALVFINHSQFTHGFSRFGSVSSIVKTAHHDGMGSSSLGLGATLASITILFGSIGFGQVSSYFAGEVRQPGKTILKGMLISVAITAVGLAAISLLAENRFGTDFLNSAQYLSNANKWPVAASPFLNLFIGIAAPHIWLAVLLGLGTIAGVAAVAAPTFLMATRNMLAHSLDRVLPARLGVVNDRTHTPIVATVVVMLLMLGFLAGFVYSSSSFVTYLSVSSIVGFVTFASVGLAAVVFPFRRKKMFQDSPIPKRMLAGIPVFAIVGAIDAALMTVYLILLFTNSAATGVTQGGVLVVLIVLVLALTAIWVIAWAQARYRGIDLGVVQEQLPPE